MLASPGLNAGFLVRRDHELVILQRPAFPCAGIQIENATGFVGKVGIAREDPATVVPGPNDILMQPAPQRAAADRSHQAGLTDLAGQIRGAPARQRQVVRGREFASPSLDLRSEEHTSELQSRLHLVCRLLLEKKKKQQPERHWQTMPTSHW